MPSLQERLASILRDVLPVEEEPDGALTVRHDGTFASLRVVTIVEDLDLVSLTQVLAWDLPLTKKLSDQVAKQARDINFGTVTLVEKISEKARAAQLRQGRGQNRGCDAAIQLSRRGLTDDALRTLILLVLDTGAQIRRQQLLGVCLSLQSRQDRQSEQVPKISMVWLTSENPCLVATSAAHASTSWSPTSMVEPQLRHTRWW